MSNTSSTPTPVSSGSSDQKPPMSSGSEGDVVVVDERKRKRMISNRESARRSRMRKQQHMDELLNQVAQLQKENSEIVMRVNATAEVYVNVESENSILRAQMGELSDRLQSLKSVLHIVEQVSGFAMDIPEIPDPLMKPWQIPHPFQPIAAATSNMFNF